MRPTTLSTLVVILAIAVLTGFPKAAQAQALSNAARIRVFKEATITLYPGEYCYGSNSPAAIQAAEGEPTLFTFNKKAGMPRTEDTPFSFGEYVIEAGKPLTIMMQWEGKVEGKLASCGPIGTTLYPQAGKDYDVTIGYSGNCYVRVRELYEITPGKVEARPVPTGASFPCAKN